MYARGVGGAEQSIQVEAQPERPTRRHVARVEDGVPAVEAVVVERERGEGRVGDDGAEDGGVGGVEGRGRATAQRTRHLVAAQDR